MFRLPLVLRYGSTRRHNPDRGRRLDFARAEPYTDPGPTAQRRQCATRPCPALAAARQRWVPGHTHCTAASTAPVRASGYMPASCFTS